MDDGARSLLQQQDTRLQNSAVSLPESDAAMTTNNYQQTAPAAKMLVGPWYLDEFGNPTREVKRLR
jgi:hypothetical protein